jgi:daunorubicin/doxorubicin transport system permease protein
VVLGRQKATAADGRHLGLPGWLQGFVAVNPVSHLVTAARELTATGGTGPDVWWALLGAGAIVVVFAPLTVRAYMRKV